MSDIVLPKGKIKADLVNPRKLLIYSPPKAGKTTLMAELNDSLLVDLEDGAGYVDAVKVKIESLAQLGQLLKKVKEEGKPYKYGILDTLTVLEDMSKGLALKMYRDTPIGAKFGLNIKTGQLEDKDILTLPNGAGYYWVRLAFFKIIDMFDEAFEYKIYLGHIKDKQIDEQTNKVIAANVDLTGKLKSLMCATCDSIAYLYRKGNETRMTFVATDDVTCGSRSEHLRNQDILVAEMTDQGYKAYWDKIYV